jgi:hypothetical protein
MLGLEDPGEFEVVDGDAAEEVGTLAKDQLHVVDGSQGLWERRKLEYLDPVHVLREDLAELRPVRLCGVAGLRGSHQDVALRAYEATLEGEGDGTGNDTRIECKLDVLRQSLCNVY